MRAYAASLPFLLMGSVFVPLIPACVAQLPATAPTQDTGTGARASTTARRSGSQPAQVSCAGGQLEVHAQNSSLNQILNAISRCTGMHITGHVADQRVFGNYGPSAPATVLATLLDGTGTNMLLQETDADQPAELVLTARVGGATPPPASTSDDPDSEPENPVPAAAAPAPATQNPYRQAGQRGVMRQGPPMDMQPGMASGNQTPVPQPYAGSAVTSPQPIPQPINNVNGSASNTSPTASTYPTTNSVPLDAVATPSTTPPTDGIVDAPNPPPAGSDTAAALNGAPQGTPGTTNINPGATSQTTTPGASNSTPDSNGSGAQLTPEQIFQQLQERVRQQEQQSNQQNGDTSASPQ